MAASPQTQLQTREDTLTEHADASPLICHLLGLPPELRLLIYEAYFGSTKMRELYLGWGQKLDLSYKQRKPGHDQNVAALLRTCKRIHDEALPIHDTSNVPVLVHGRYLVRTNQPRTTKWLDACQLHFLEQVPTVKVTFSCFIPRNIIWSMRDLCELIGWGKDMKSLTFTAQRGGADLWTGEESEELARLIAKLHCPSNIEGLRWAS
ncbi:hypothetical protein LTR56_010323 [Elasticomyces elasticus]|nr:hypothetical protein LTR56_010323 [Elasticomyces elasticus]KAK3656891.1 hypothetical protein LTR22_009553 [Elasticomyces elasticus]KAK5766122.1 hypothetical protein LTS12_003605 [Elasticomyces elasticus]